MNEIQTVFESDPPSLPWQDTVSSLEKLARRGDPGGVRDPAARRRLERLARQLADRGAVARAGVLPCALRNVERRLGAAVPGIVRRALDRALDAAIDNLPRIDARVIVCPEVSRSMVRRRAGGRAGRYRRVDAAALVTMALVRNSVAVEVVPWDGRAHPFRCDPADGVDALALHLTAIGGGGSDPLAPLRVLNERRDEADLLVYVSDRSPLARTGEAEAAVLLAEWRRFKRRCPAARLVWLGLRPRARRRVRDGRNRLLLAGFSDDVFEAIRDFAGGAGARPIAVAGPATGVAVGRR